MMFGELGQPRPRRVASASSTARSTPASTSSTPPTSTRTASRRRSSARRSRAAGATTSSSRPSSTARWATDSNRAGNSRRWIIARGREQPAAPGHRLDRPLSGPPPRARHRHRGDALGADRPRARRQGALLGTSTFPASQIVEAQWVARDRGLERFVTEQPPYSILVRGIEADVLPAVPRTASA